MRSNLRMIEPVLGTSKSRVTVIVVIVASESRALRRRPVRRLVTTIQVTVAPQLENPKQDCHAELEEKMPVARGRRPRI